MSTPNFKHKDQLQSSYALGTKS